MCLSVCVCVRVFLCWRHFLSVCSLCLCLCLCLCLHVPLCVSPSLSLSLCLSVSLTPSLSFARSLSLSPSACVSLLVCLFCCLLFTGIGCFGVGELSPYYWLLHSCWHVSIELSTCCILLSLLHHPLLSQLQSPPPQSSVAGYSINTPVRSLSEAVASGEQHHLHATVSSPEGGNNSLHKPLVDAFWRVLQHSQMQLLTLQEETQGPFSHPTEQESPQRRLHQGDSSEGPPLYPQAGLHCLLGVLAPHPTAQQLLQALSRLLVLQYSAHKRHRSECSSSNKGQGDTDTQPLPSPTYGEEGLVRVGTAAPLSPPSRSPHSTNSTSPTSSQGCYEDSACSEGAELGCLWCIASTVLTQEELLKLHAERLKWACRLRLTPQLSCLLLPWWLQGRQMETETRPIRRHLRIPQTDVLLYT